MLAVLNVDVIGVYHALAYITSPAALAALVPSRLLMGVQNSKNSVSFWYLRCIHQFQFNRVAVNKIAFAVNIGAKNR